MSSVVISVSTTPSSVRNSVSKLKVELVTWYTCVPLNCTRGGLRNERCVYVSVPLRGLACGEYSRDISSSMLRVAERRLNTLRTFWSRRAVSVRLPQDRGDNTTIATETDTVCSVGNLTRVIIWRQRVVA